MITHQLGLIYSLRHQYIFISGATIISFPPKNNKDSSSLCYDPPQKKVVEMVQFLKCCSLQNQKIKCTLIQRVPHCTTTSSLINATLCRQLNSSKNYDNVGASPDVFKLFVLFWPPKTLTPPRNSKICQFVPSVKIGIKNNLQTRHK